MRAPVDGDDPVAAAALAGLVVDGDVARRLDDPRVAAERRQPVAQAALGEAAVLGPVGAVHPLGAVVARQLLERGPAPAVGLHAPAPRRGQRRHPSVGRIHDERRALPGALHRLVDGVVGAGDVQRRARLRPGVEAAQRRPLRIQGRALLVGEALLAGELRRPLERRRRRVGPDALQVRLAPRRPRRGVPRVRRRLRRAEPLTEGGDAKRDDRPPPHAHPLSFSHVTPSLQPVPSPLQR